MPGPVKLAFAALAVTVAAFGLTPTGMEARVAGPVEDLIHLVTSQTDGLPPCCLVPTA